MAKSNKQFFAKKLRRRGLSINEIAKRLKVSKSSVSLWCSDIKLTDKQIQKLHEQMVRGSYKGRLAGVKMQKERKRKKIETCLLKARKDIAYLKKRELFIAGLGLYWGEGSKKSSARFYNSDPEIIRFMMKWFREVMNIEENRFLMYININQIHKKRLKEVINFWSKITRIHLSQFRNPTLIKMKNKKIYENFHNHYGTLCIRISRGSDLLYQILGWIKAISEAG